MIRLFEAICKSFFIDSEGIDDGLLYNESSERFNHYGQRCPKCGALGVLAEHGSYDRGLTSIKHGKYADYQLKPKRFYCSSCISTHALLPDVIIPYCTYSIRFMLHALLAYLKRGDKTVEQTCEQLGIAISTLYEWKKNLINQMNLFLGYMLAKEASILTFIEGLYASDECLSVRLSVFYHKHDFSFMQNKNITPQSIPP
jgi:ribosomal protein S27AE